MGASVATALPAAPGANDRKGYLMSYVFPPPPVTSVPVLGTEARFPVHRIYCVGRNYEEHAQEMGFTGREPPFFFMKPADALVLAAGEAPALLPYPSLTQNLHHEIELVVAIGKGGRDIAAADAHQHIFGYAVGQRSWRTEVNPSRVTLVQIRRRGTGPDAEQEVVPADPAAGVPDTVAPVAAVDQSGIGD